MYTEITDIKTTNKKDKEKVQIVNSNMMEQERKNHDYRKKRSEELKKAKEQGNKKELDVEKVLSTFLGKSDEEIAMLEEMKHDPKVIHSSEEGYYLDAPSEVKTTEDYIKWLQDWEKRIKL